MNLSSAPGLRHWRWWAITFACTLCIAAPALVNGFPLVYSDTGTYLASAFEGLVPADRPYWYGGFILLASFGGAWLMGVVIVQALLAALYIRATVRVWTPVEEWKVSLTFCAVAGPLTGLGWYAGQLMPDILTSIGAMAMAQLLIGQRSIAERTIHMVVIIGSAWCHSSNLLILPLVGLLLIAASHGRSWIAWRKPIGWWIGAAVCAWGGLIVANGIVDDKPYLTRGSHVFLVGRLIDTGMLEPLLRAECPDRQWGICAHVDSLPITARQFLWWDSSPLHEQGGWDATREEYGQVVRASFSTPGRLWSHVVASISSTADQLTRWHLGHEIESRWYRDPGSPPALMVAKGPSHGSRAFRCALQQGGWGELSLRWPNIGYRIVLALSIMVLAWWGWANTRGTGPTEAPLVVLAISTVVIGAWVCASLSEVDPRYLARVSWLLPLAAIVVLVRRFRERSQERPV